MQEIEMNGIIYEFPDGMSQDDIRSALIGIYNQEQYKQENKGYTIEDVKRSLGLGTRGVLEGLGSITEPFIQPLNAINQALGGQADYFATNAGESLSNAMNLPTPQTAQENLVNMAVQGGASAVPFLGLGNALAKSSNMATKGIGESISANPVMDVASSVAGGYGVGAAQNADLGTGGQVAAGIISSLLPSAGMGAVAIPTSYTQSFAKNYPQRKAGTLLENVARDNQQVRQSIEDFARQGGLIDGSSPTLAQVTGDPRLAVLEKTLQNKGVRGSDITERYNLQRQAREDSLNPLVEQVNTRNTQAMQQPYNDVMRYSPFSRLDNNDITAGRDLREHFNNEYAQAKAQTREAYNAIDPQGTASFDIQPLLLEFANVAGESRYQVMPKEINSMMAQMQDDINNGVNVSYRDLQAMRTQLSDMQQNAMTSGDSNLARISGTMKGQIDDYINKSGNVEMQGSAPTVRQGTKAYNDLTKEATRMTRSDPYFEDLNYLSKRGLNRDSVEALIGADGVREINRMYPNLIRSSGRLQADDVATEMLTGQGMNDVGDEQLIESLRSRLDGSIGRYNQVYNKNKEYLMQNNTAPHTGFTPEQAQLLKEAQALRTQQGQRFEQGANLPLTKRGERTGGQAITDGQIIDNYLKTGAVGEENIGQLLSAVDSQEMRDIILERLIARGAQSTSKNGIVDPAKLNQFIDSYAGSLHQLDPEAVRGLRQAANSQQDNINAQNALNSLVKQDQAGQYNLRGVRSRASYPDIPMKKIVNPETYAVEQVNAPRFTEDELDLFNRIRQDQQMADTARMNADTGGSQTAQLLESMEELGMLSQPRIQDSGLMSRIGGTILDKVFRDKSRLANDELTNAILDPQYALKLMEQSYNQSSVNPISQLNNLAGQGGFGVLDPFMAMLQRYKMPFATSSVRAGTLTEPKEEN